MLEKFIPPYTLRNSTDKNSVWYPVHAIVILLLLLVIHYKVKIEQIKKIKRCFWLNNEKIS
jgi:hypothetical protein